MRRALCLAASAALAVAAPAAAQGVVDVPGTGWSRAPDLSVYAALRTYEAIAREQQLLCNGFAPARVDARWLRAYGARHAAVEAALAARYGAPALAAARIDPGRRVPCEDIIGHPWRGRYARLLRLLEIRLGLA